MSQILLRTKLGVFEVGQFHGVIAPTDLCCHGIGHKIVYNSICIGDIQEIYPRFLYQSRSFRGRAM